MQREARIAASEWSASRGRPAGPRAPICAERRFAIDALAATWRNVGRGGRAWRRASDRAVRRVKAELPRWLGTAPTLEALAEQIGIDPAGLARTVREFNAACRPGKYNPAILDGVRTDGITPPKSNWALPIDKPPYTGFVVTCGITFSFSGLRINERCEVQDTSDRTIPGLYAAGEIVGGIFYENYLGGAGLMSGAVFGRIAGASAATRT